MQDFRVVQDPKIFFQRRTNARAVLPDLTSYGFATGRIMMPMSLASAQYQGGGFSNI